MTNSSWRLYGVVALTIPLLFALAAPLPAQESGGVTIRTPELRIEGSSDAPPAPLADWTPVTISTRQLQIVGSSDTALPPLESAGELTIRTETLRIIGEDGAEPAPVAEQQEGPDGDSQGREDGDPGRGQAAQIPAAVPIPGFAVPPEILPIPPAGTGPQQQDTGQRKTNPILLPPIVDPKAFQPQSPGTVTNSKKPPPQDGQQNQGAGKKKKPVENVEVPPILPPSTVQPKTVPLK